MILNVYITKPMKNSVILINQITHVREREREREGEGGWIMLGVAYSFVIES
jgi:hypothetical protein